MVVGLVAGVAIGAAGTLAIEQIVGRRRSNGAKTYPGRRTSIQESGSASAEAAVLHMMPGSAAMSTTDLLVSMEVSSSLASALLQQLWPQLNKIAIKIVKESVEPMFAEKLPAPFRKMHFDTLDLGKEPIQLENFVVHPVVDDTLRMELEINWDSSCNILLAGLPGGATVGVKTIKLRSRLLIVCRPILDVAPIISSAQVAFINQPFIDLDFTGLADVADWAGIRPMIDQGIKDGLSGSLVLPRSTFVKVDPACDFIKAYQRPMGVLRVKLTKGRDFPILEFRGGLIKDVPDPYVKLELGNKEWKSSTLKNTTTPEWNETFDFVLADFGQVLHMNAFDENMVESDTDLGSIQITALELLKNGGKKEFTLPRKTEETKGWFSGKKSSCVGKISLECELLPFCKDISSLTTRQNSPTPNAMMGMIIVYISKLVGLPVPKEEAASCIKVKVGDLELQTGTVSYDPETGAAAEEAASDDKGEASKALEESVLNPEFNAAFQIPFYNSDPDAGAISFELMNGKTSLGSFDITEDVYLVMRDELAHSTNNIGGAIVHCGIETLGVEGVTKTNGVAPMEVDGGDIEEGVEVSDLSLSVSA